MYYIDLEKSNSLMKCKIYAPDEAETIFADVQSFAVFQNHVFCLTENSELYLLDDSDGSSELLSEHTEKFFFNGNMIISNNRNIFMFSVVGSYAEQLSILEIDETDLVCVIGNLVYFQSGNALFSIDIDTMQVSNLCQGYDHYAAVHFWENKLYILAATIDRTTLTVTWETITQDFLVP
jgi:hypothetical protein